MTKTPRQRPLQKLLSARKSVATSTTPSMTGDPSLANATPNAKPPPKRTRATVMKFTIPVLIGCVAAVSALFGTGVVQVPEDVLVKLRGFNVSDLRVVVSLAETLKEAKATASKWVTDEDPPGVVARKRGALPHYPVVLLPGFINTGLDLWAGKDCSKGSFRTRWWAGLGMAESALLRTKCWAEHLALDPATGSDPPGIKLRPGSGLEAADFIFPTYWVWGLMIQALGEFGYTANDLVMAPYDWRMSFPALQRRDGAFVKMKSTIETTVATNGGRKVVIATHSMGALTLFWFMNWLEHTVGPSWFPDHVHAVVSISGVWLGVPKAQAAILSGEMRDTAQLGPLAPILEQILSRQERRDLFRTWGSIGALLPKGGNKVWGNGAVVRFPNGTGLSNDELMAHFARSDDGLPSNGWHKSTVGWADHSFVSGKPYPSSKCPERSWANPTQCALPKLKNVTIYCMYGVGRPTEIGYDYSDGSDGPLRINTSSNDAGERIKLGVHEADGDGTAPLVSLSAMCLNAWKKPSYNPGKVKVVTREYFHTPAPLDLRGGPKTADHVDLLGNWELLSDFIDIVTANPSAETMEDRILSDSRAIASKVPFPN